MNAYDLKSYELALLLRKKKTIVVEGVTDKRAISRMLLEEEAASGKKRQCVVDEINLLSREKSFSGLGHRQRVINTGVHFASISTNLKCLVDREWDGVDLVNLQDPHPPMPAQAWGEVTHGHSIENYWFTATAACSFLKMQFGAELEGKFFSELDHRFAAMLRISAAFSLAAKRLNIISVCQKGLLKAEHVIWFNQIYSPTDAIDIAAKERSITPNLKNEIQKELDRADFSALSIPTIQWICHGHLGEQMLRACAANLAQEFGSSEIKEKIERGFQDVKLSHDTDWLAAENSPLPAPLDSLIAWAS